MNRKVLLFGDSTYTNIFNDTIREKVKKDYGVNSLLNIISFIRRSFINYFPLFGHLPVNWQLSLKDNFKKLFGDLDVKTSTLSSAFVIGVLSMQVLFFLDGFDLGFTKEVWEGWARVPKYFSYIGEYLPFLGLPYGFPEVFTKSLAVCLVVGSAIRIAFGVFGKPFGSLVLEAPTALVRYFSEKSSFKKEAEEIIGEGTKRTNTIKEFTEKDRRDREHELAKDTVKDFLKVEVSE